MLNKGLALAMKNEYEPAYNALKNALRILRASLGPNHCEVGDCLQSLGDVCMKLLVESPQKMSDKKDEASILYKQAREIFAESFGTNHTKVQQMDSLIFITDNFANLAFAN